MRFISDAQRRAVFASLNTFSKHGNVLSVSNPFVNRFATRNDERKRLFDILPSVITEVITPEDMLFYNTKGHISSRLSEKVVDALVEKHGFDMDTLYTTSYPGYSNRYIKLQIESVLDRGPFIAELGSKGIYMQSEIDDMVRMAIKKLIEEEKYYGEDLNHVVGDVCIELNKMWDTKYGERPCGADIKKIVEKYYNGDVPI